jgi:hypothetical protein
MTNIKAKVRVLSPAECPRPLASLFPIKSPSGAMLQ